MKNRLKLLSTAVVMACSGYAFNAQAVLNDREAGEPGYILTINTGSNFTMEVSTGFHLPTAITGLNGIELGTAQAASGSHTGAPDSSENPDIDNPWLFFGNTGMHYTSTATNVLSASANTATVDMSGWGVTWNGIAAIPMGSGAWGTNADGIAEITCATDCSVGDTYTLYYTATVPIGDQSGFGNVAYGLNLSGTIGDANLPPVANNFTVSVLSNIAADINLLAHITDPNNDTGTWSDIDLASVSITSGDTCAAIINNSDGTVTFPACTEGDYNFVYTVADLVGVTSTSATVTVNVAANPAPNAVADSATTASETTVVIDVLSNDSDDHPGGALDPTSVAIVTAATNGSTSVNATTGNISYTPNAGFSGVDIFTYTVADNTAGVSAVTPVSVTVNAMNTPSTSNTFAVGSTALSAGSTTGIITAADIGIVDNEKRRFDTFTAVESCIGGCFDFVISGLSNGATAQIVLPLSVEIPTPAEGNNLFYRKLNSSTGSWYTFDRSADDAIHTAPGTVSGNDIICPAPNDTVYNNNSGLNNPGHRCVRLTIVDGGPNDDDGLANGSIVDPGGIAETTTTRISGTDGCNMGGNSKARDHAEWLLLAGFIALLGWFNIRRRKA